MEGVAAVTAFIYMKKWRLTYWKWFPFYLAFIVLADMTGTYIASQKLYILSFDFYMYLVIPIEFLFFFWIFYKSYKVPKNKLFPKVSVIIYLIGFLSDFFCFRHSHYFHFSLSYTIGNILLLLLILKYFNELVNSDKVLRYQQDILFWVSVGLLTYYLGSSPFFGLRNILVYKYENLNRYYSYFVNILDSLMYLTFTLGVICGKPNS